MPHGRGGCGAIGFYDRDLSIHFRKLKFTYIFLKENKVVFGPVRVFASFSPISGSWFECQEESWSPLQKKRRQPFCWRANGIKKKDRLDLPFEIGSVFS